VIAITRLCDGAHKPTGAARQRHRLRASSPSFRPGSRRNEPERGQRCCRSLPVTSRSGYWCFCSISMARGNRMLFSRWMCWCKSTSNSFNAW